MPTLDTAAGQHRPPFALPPGVGAVGRIIGPFFKTGRYYTESWWNYLHGPSSGLPVARPTLTLAAEALVDEVVLAGFRMIRRFPGPETFERIELEVVAALEFYQRNGWLDNPEGFFVTPPPLSEASEVTTRHVKDGRRSHDRIVFDSGYTPRPGEPGGERWSSYTANDREYALVLRHREPRPWLVCIHGSEMGRAAIDLRLFRAWHLHEDLGLNVVLPVLPMHGPRRRNLPDRAAFPGEQLLDNVHATAQAVWDVRRVLSWIRSQEPDSPIGLNSMSLGGYIASLVASLDDGLTCAILGVPVINLIDLFGYHAGFAAIDPRRRPLDLAKPIGEMLSPLSLTCRVPPRGRFVYAGIADQVVLPRAHALRLWEHWGKPETVWYHGGHALFFRSRPVEQFIEDALAQSGMVRAAVPA
jgi:pimeloyl-ACP methyl ester carboxylesterase